MKRVILLGALAAAGRQVRDRSSRCVLGEQARPPAGTPKGATLDAFLPSALTINAGDSVTFSSATFHTVTYVPKPAPLFVLSRSLIRLAFLALTVALVMVPSSTGAGITVVIDPGHDLHANLRTEPIGPGSSTLKILDGGGTRGVVTGMSEAELNLAVALRLRPLLERAGIRVLLTRTTTAGTSMGNIARARIANRAHAALFLRIHADGAADSRAAGTHTLYPALHSGWTDDVYAASKRAAGIVQRELVRALGFPDRGLQERADFTGFNWSNVPVILVEMGFMTNPVEDRLLSTAAYRQRAAVGLCRGTLRFLGRPPSAC